MTVTEHRATETEPASEFETLAAAVDDALVAVEALLQQQQSRVFSVSLRSVQLIH